MKKKRATKKNVVMRNYYDVTVTKRGKRVKPVGEATFLLPTGSYTSSTNPTAGDTIWYDHKKESFVETTLRYLKGWFR